MKSTRGQIQACSFLSRRRLALKAKPELNDEARSESRKRSLLHNRDVFCIQVLQKAGFNRLSDWLDRSAPLIITRGPGPHAPVVPSRLACV